MMSFALANQILVPQFRLFGKKKKQEEGGNTVSFLQKKETAKTETIQKKSVFLKRKESM